eukprot:CAMPEP_0172317624 /NCGR_PEP_ID=MMETSP1058-20130122/32235_1 /TAXON_ID=83371 /ORGANISM="Detonula confervacea, Strain CCMP 353" /LENGTH=483 /DNA_ID=CAMNT_0013032235 /DNA_START=155 /DNA_END=1606 /DNA_ORIENTATION=-
MSGFHYDQEPRGTSYISQISKQDLWERRQMKRPSKRQQQRQRRPAPNSRGAIPQQEHYENYNSIIANDDEDVDDVADDDGDEFDDFKDNVSTNLKSMTDLLKEMHRSQSVQTADVQRLTFKVVDMAERLSKTEQAKHQMMMDDQNHSSPSSGDYTDMGDRIRKLDNNFGTSLDGKFNQQIKDVIDEFDMIDAASKSRDTAIGNNNNNSGGGTRNNEQYYGSKVAQLEAKINNIDETLQSMEDNFNTQMEHMALSVNQRLDDIEDASFDNVPFDNGMQFQQHPPPPESFLEERPPLPPPLQPPPLPHPQESHDNPFMDDDGRTYYQERNYNEPNVPPPPPHQQPTEMASSQNQISGRSVNAVSEGHHYKDENTSFISAFSKADNDRRREFQPFRDPRRNQISPGEQLPRGVRAPPNQRLSLPPPQPNMMVPEYFEERYFYEDGPMMDGPMMDGPMMGGPMMDGPMMDGPMMEEDYFYDDTMYEF